MELKPTLPVLCDVSHNPNIDEESINFEEENDTMQILKLYEEKDERKINDVIEEFTGRKIRVLSLFDGIATGLHVLNELGLEVDAYFASETNNDAISVGKLNFGDKIKHLGDVTFILEKDLKQILPIDLLIGGSPCNDLSFVNPRRKGLFDIRGSGVLFFEFYRIKIILERIQKKHKMFWMFENVTAMDQKFKKVISRCLNSSPAMIDAQYFSAAYRARHFWGNIPGMKKMMIPPNAPELQDKLLKGFGRKATTDKLLTITTNVNSLRRVAYNSTPVQMNDKEDIPWVTELETVFGFPRHYTDTGYLSLLQRRQLLGKAWNVDVVTHIFGPLLSYFAHVEK